MKLICTVTCCFIFSLLTKISAQINKQDSLILVDLYNSTNNIIWNNHLNWLTDVPVASWYGITVSENRVTKIDLRNNRLTGMIPASLGNLQKLQALDLGGNAISGSIPASLGKLANLQTLSIDNASLTGSIPSSLGELINLQALNFFNNQLSGIIPHSFGNLVNLQKLYLNRNQLTGAIPPDLGNLTSLNFLYLETNQLTGPIPSSLGNLLNLIQMELNNNQLTGTIPSSFGKLANLQDLSLYINNLTGAIPASLGNLKKLRFFEISNNQLSGTIPASFGGLTSLIVLNLSDNHLSGAIPSSFANLPHLQELLIRDNQLSGRLPAGLGNIHSLTHIFLSNNRLSGVIPSSIGDLKQLSFLAVDNNSLRGNIPKEVGDLASLYYLDLSNNHFSDTIPGSLNRLANLQFFELNNNHFTFNGMEQLAQTFRSGQTFIYSPQAPIKLHNKNNVLSVSAGGTLANNKFYWYKDGQLITTVHGDSTFTITAPGAYYVEIRNSIATDLSLQSDTMGISVLPVDLIAFSAAKQQTTVTLNWRTTNEINNNYFVIERSVDSKLFYSIGTVKGLNSNNMNNYFFTDSAPSNGTNYYRLKQVDKDGRFNYSGIASVEFISNLSMFTFSPNPADNDIKISIPAINTTSQIIIYDFTGRKVIHEEVAANVTSKQINISRLAAGNYYVSWEQNGRRQTLKLIKR